MKMMLEKLFIENWERKVISLVSAIIIWFLVSNSITVTRSLSNIPVKVIGLPVDKTIEGLQPNGLMNERVTLTLTGSKALVQNLTSGDLEVVIDARDKGDEWIAQIDKRSLTSLNPDIDLKNHISEVTGNDFIITLKQLVTEKIPITVTKPIGDPPPGYQFLDIWPQRLYQRVSGPKEQVDELKSKGIEITFDLNTISASELNLMESSKGPGQQDEISFLIPQSWKRIALSLLSDTLQELNDPDAEFLRIDFLRREFLPLDVMLPVAIFFPVETLSSINPMNYSMQENSLIKKDNGISLLTVPLYVRDVSRLFLDVVRNNLEVVIVAKAVLGPRESLPWSVQFVNSSQLENNYVELARVELNDKRIQGLQPQLRDNYLRNRFRNYMRQLELFISPDKKLLLDIKIEDGMIVVKKVAP